MSGIGAHAAQGGGHDEWLTPPHILEALGKFDLDPCAPVIRPWATAAKHYSFNENGLAQPWAGRVWLNPPYGNKTGDWLNRLAGHGNGIALIFARTETSMFFEHVWRKAHALFFIEGRLHFHHADGRRAAANAGGPSVLVAYGNDCALTLCETKLPGQFVQMRVA